MKCPICNLTIAEVPEHLRSTHCACPTAEHNRHGDLAVVMEAHRSRRKALHDERAGIVAPFCKVATLRAFAAST